MKTREQNDCFALKNMIKIEISKNGTLFIDSTALLLLTSEECAYLRDLGKSLKARLKGGMSK